MKRIITRIEAVPSFEKKMKTAAYCRVSTNQESQEISFQNQQNHYRRLIQSRTDMEFAGIYFDQAVSGTHRDTRPGLRKMLIDCENGKIDLILTKSISRFARNTTDCLELVRRLREMKVSIIFEKEKLNTGSIEGEWILSILASLAEDESRAISANENWALQKRYQSGTFKLSRAPYGYDIQNGNLIINPKEAETVRYIYDCILSGMGTPSIAQDLNNRKIPAKRGGSWHAGTILNTIIY